MDACLPHCVVMKAQSITWRSGALGVVWFLGAVACFALTGAIIVCQHVRACVRVCVCVTSTLHVYCLSPY